MRLDRQLRAAFVVVCAPGDDEPTDAAGVLDRGVDWWPLAVCRALDDLVLHLRFNEPEIGTIVWKSSGDLDVVVAVDAALRGARRRRLVCP